jgi:hypothetical protein
MAAVLGLALGLREVGALLNELAARASAFGPGPIPHGIDWIGQTEGARRFLLQWDGLLALAAWLLGAALTWRVLRLMNPGGTLLARGAGPVRSLFSRLAAPLERPLVRRGFITAFVTAYACGGIRALIQGESPNPPPLSTWGLPALVFLLPGRPITGLIAAFLLGGALLWFLWGEWSSLTPRQERMRAPRETVAAGLVVGACALPALLPLTLWGHGAIREVLDAAGLVSYQFWNGCLWTLALGLPIAFFALGCVGHVLAAGSTAGSSWRWTAGPGLVLLVLVAAAEATFFNVVARGRYDMRGDLTAIVRAAPARPGDRTLLVLAPGRRPITGFLAGSDLRGLDPSEEGRRRIWDYLRRRQYCSAAAEEAFVRLHDAASLSWDSAESLRVNLANLEHNPRPIFGRLLVEKLSTCAPTPANRAMLRQAADAARFHQSPYWMRILGLLHHRFGDRAKAVWCLGWAGLSQEEIVKTIGTRAPLTNGEISGRILLNGRPAAGLAVGVLPADRWRALAGRVRPFELRWVAAAAVTDTEGYFRVGSLGEGAFLLVLSGDARRLPPRRGRLRAEGSPGPILLDPSNPRRDTGTLRIRVASPAEGLEPSPEAQSA